MPPLTPDSIFWISCCAQLAGLFLLTAARCGQRAPQGWWLPAAFFAGMAAVGFTAMLAFSVGSGCWAACGATLSIMAVGATIDFPPPAPSRAVR